MPRVTRSEGSGGADIVVMEIDPATGDVLSSTLFGGEQDDAATGAATDGVDLYVVGESRSFAEGGNAVGENDLVLLRYTLEPTEVLVAVDIKPESCPNPLNVRARGVLRSSPLWTQTAHAPWSMHPGDRPCAAIG